MNSKTAGGAGGAAFSREPKASEMLMGMVEIAECGIEKARDEGTKGRRWARAQALLASPARRLGAALSEVEGEGRGEFRFDKRASITEARG